MASETIADIVAEMRRRRFDVWVSEFKSFADRIEAAAKREAVTGHGLGNAAALREVVERIVKSLSGKMADAPAAMTSHEVAILKQCRAALAKPPRNCDRYSHDEALSVWAAEKENGKNGCFDEWLYAPATEQEGGEK